MNREITSELCRSCAHFQGGVGLSDATERPTSTQGWLATGRRPKSGRLCTGCELCLGIWGAFGRVSGSNGRPVWGLAGKDAVTFLGRDAQGLTSPAVTGARVMQPGLSTGGNQQWRMARQQRDDVRAAPSRSRLRSIAPPFVHRFSGPGRTLMEGKTGVVPVPSLNLKICLFERCGACGAFLFPYRQRTVVLTPCGWAGMAGPMAGGPGPGERKGVPDPPGPNGCAVAARSPAGSPGWVAVDCW